jgi:hypothetical protein
MVLNPWRLLNSSGFRLTCRKYSKISANDDDDDDDDDEEGTLLAIHIYLGRSKRAHMCGYTTGHSERRR